MSVEDTEDVLFVEPAVFYEVRNIPSDDKDVALVIMLIDKYGCFIELPSSGGNETGAGRSAFRTGQPSHGHNHHQRRGNGFAFHRLPPIKRHKQVSVEDKIKRDVQSILNKVTQSTLDKLLNKILELADEKNVHHILDVLVHTSYRQDKFIDFYCRTLSLLNQRFGDRIHSELASILEGVMLDYKQCLEVLDVPVNVLSSCTEDEFCTYVKMKKLLLGKNTLLTFVMSTNLHRSELCNLESWVDMHMHFLRTRCQTASMIDLGIVLMHHLFQCGTPCARHIHAYVAYVQDELLPRITLKKLIFQLDDFMRETLPALIAKNATNDGHDEQEEHVAAEP